jgi:pimeloyl-ACP methyl ester carboxylesterase
MISGHFMAQRLRLHTLEWGDPAAPPVILVHGGRDHARAWDDVAQALAPTHRVIVPDLRGHGDSQWADAGGYTMPCFVYDLVALIRHLNLPEVSLVGHSLGGNIALRMAGLYPELVRRVVSIEGLGPSPQLAQEMAGKPVEVRLRGWIDEQQRLDARAPRFYPTIDGAGADDGAEPASVGGAGGASDAARGAAERGWPVCVEIRPVSAVVAADRSVAGRDTHAVGPDHLPGAAGVWVGQLGFKPGHGWAGCGVSQRDGGVGGGGRALGAS